jgi:hypothetical protein
LTKPYSVLAVTRDVMNDFTPAGGMADMDRALYSEVINHGRNVVSIVIHVVSVPDLTGAPVTTSVVCNNPVAVGQKKCICASQSSALSGHP